MAAPLQSSAGPQNSSTASTSGSAPIAPTTTTSLTYSQEDRSYHGYGALSTHDIDEEDPWKDDGRQIHQDADGSPDHAGEIPPTQAGVQKIEAMARTWSSWSLWFAYAGYVLSGFIGPFEIHRILVHCPFPSRNAISNLDPSCA